MCKKSFLGEESLGEKLYMGEKYVQEEFLSEYILVVIIYAIGAGLLPWRAPPC